jgi:hypothetical protein
LIKKIKDKIRDERQIYYRSFKSPTSGLNFRLGRHPGQQNDFKNHIDATIAKGLAMFGFIKRLSKEFQDRYTLKSLFMSLVRSRLEYACCVWQPFYAVYVARIERIQEKFVKYALRRVGWDTM